MGLEEAEGYSFSDCPSTMDLLSEVAEDYRDRIIEGLCEVLGEQDYWGEKNTEQIYERSERIQKKLESDEDSLTEGEREVVEQALVEELQDIKFESPWHPYNLLSDERTSTFPFQHPTCILYLPEGRQVFLSGPGKEDIRKRERSEEHGVYRSFRNPESLFEQGELKRKYSEEGSPQSFFSVSPVEERLQHPEDTDAEVVFEVEVSSERLSIHEETPEDERTYEDTHGMTERFVTSERFSNKVMESNFMDSINFRVEKDCIQTDHIKGVTETGEEDEKSFLPLEDYHGKVFSHFPFRVPWNPSGEFSLPEEDAREARMDKMVDEGLFEALKKSGKFLSACENLLSSLGLEEGEGIAGQICSDGVLCVNFKNRDIPKGCNRCGRILEDKICSNCEADRREEFFKPTDELKRNKRALKFLSYLYRDPLRWEEKIEKEWSRRGEKYVSPFFYLDQARKGLEESLVEFGNRLANYARDIIEVSEGIDTGSIDSKSRMNSRRSLQELERCSRNLEAIK